MDLIELKKLHDKAYQSGQITRENSAGDMTFYFVTQWDDNSLAESELGYRGEFNILKKAGRQIISDLASNPVQVDFEPKDGTRDDAAELLDGLYRTDDQNNATIEAYENGKQEAVVCGVGAWLLYPEYKSIRSSDKSQVIRRKPIFEANNCVFWDPNAKMLDKSDAKYVSVLAAYSEDGYRDLVEELTGEEMETVSMESFKHPEQSYTFPWVGGEGKKIYVTEFYKREVVKSNMLTMVEPFTGQEMELWESSLENVMDDMIDAGYEIKSEKKVERYQVTKFVASGAEILNGKMVDGERVGEIIAGEHIPVIPAYGEHAYIEGEEHYEGVTRLAKDPSRLRNFQMSYLADIVSRSPRPKPIFNPEQIQGFEDMYAIAGADNNYPYLLANRLAGDGSPLPPGPVAVMPEQTIPQPLMLMMDLTRQAVEDVANPGLSQDIADPDISGKAVMALQSRLDMQSMIYQQHFKHAKRRDAEVYASIASEIYDAPRSEPVTMPDGTRKDMDIMQAIVDEETGDVVILNDLRDAEFDVYSKIGPDYKSQKEQTLEQIKEQLAITPPTDPMFKALQLKAMILMDGIEFDDIRDYANMQLVLMGFKEPETDEEKQKLEEAKQQPQEPSAEVLLAQAEQAKADADMAEVQRKTQQMQIDAQIEGMKLQMHEKELNLKEMELNIKAQQAGAIISKTQADTQNTLMDSQLKLKDLLTPANAVTM